MSDHFQALKQVTAPLVALLVQQKEDLSKVCNDVSGRRNAIKLKRRKEQTQVAAALRERLPVSLQRCLDTAQEKGASTWLEALPIKEYGFSLSKVEFRDSLCMRYGWRPERLPSA